MNYAPARGMWGARVPNSVSLQCFGVNNHNSNHRVFPNPTFHCDSRIICVSDKRLRPAN